LEQLNVIRLESIHVEDSNNYISVTFYPTIPHCSMATLIGLCIRVRLLRSLPSRFKVKKKKKKKKKTRKIIIIIRNNKIRKNKKKKKKKDS